LRERGSAGREKHRIRCRCFGPGYGLGEGDGRAIVQQRTPWRRLAPKGRSRRLARRGPKAVSKSSFGDGFMAAFSGGGRTAGTPSSVDTEAYPWCGRHLGHGRGRPCRRADSGNKQRLRADAATIVHRDGAVSGVRRCAHHLSCGSGESRAGTRGRRSRRGRFCERAWKQLGTLDPGMVPGGRWSPVRGVFSGAFVRIGGHQDGRGEVVSDDVAWTTSRTRAR